MAPAARVAPKAGFLASCQPMRLLLLTLAVLGVFVTASAPALAKTRYARRTGQECGHCHQNPQGGGPRNLVGLYYQAHRDLPPPTLDPGGLQAAVDRYLDDVARAVPEVIWRYTRVEALPDRPLPPLEAADDLTVLRRLALDLTSALPSHQDIRDIETGAASLADKVELYLRSADFEYTFRLYHRDIVRPRSGIFNQTPSLSKLRRLTVADRPVWSSQRFPGEPQSADCAPENLVTVSPYWQRGQPVQVCRRTADARVEVDGIRCDTEEGQASGACGCGPHLVFCWRDGDHGRVKKSMIDEGARLAMRVVQGGRPYGELLTADWTMHNGRVEHYYARLDGRLGALADADVDRGWRPVERGPEHAGVLSTHMYLNHFYNGRRWAQRTFESFMCHLTTPDFDLLDDHAATALVAYRRHPLAPADVNVNAGRACAACHVQLDGLSRVKDRWDNFGQYYETSAGQPIPQTVRFLGEEVDGIDAFGRALAGSDVFADCVAQQLWSHFLGRRFTDDEVSVRRALVRVFRESGQDFRAMIRAVVESAPYRAAAAVKLMRREQYRRSLGRVTGVAWKVDGRSGFDVFYDKVGGMDYRKIEERDLTPGQGHSLVQFKAAVETCAEAVERARKLPAARRTFLRMVEDIDAVPSDDTVDRVIESWYRRILVRPIARLDDAARADYRALFADVAAAHGAAEGYTAVCAAMFGGAEFAVY